MTVVDAQSVASAWLSKFAHTLETGDIQSIVSSFLSRGYFRDLLNFTWDYHTLHGHSGISAFLQSNLPGVRISNVRLDARVYFAPTYGRIGPTDVGVSTGFTFEKDGMAKGQGHAKLLQDENGEWKALSVFMMMDSLRDHPELGPESGVYGGHTSKCWFNCASAWTTTYTYHLAIEQVPWGSVRDGRTRMIENDPYVLVGRFNLGSSKIFSHPHCIVGAGQTGLNIASRFKQMNIPTLILERSARVGDVWRERYPTLVLHTPRPHHSRRSLLVFEHSK